MAAVVDAYWGENRDEWGDIHVLRGQQTRPLNNLLRIEDDGGNAFFAANNARWMGAGITAIEFIPIHPFTLAAHGIAVDPATGVVQTTPSPAPPARRLAPNNFIIRARISGPGANPAVIVKMRVHLHNSVVHAHLTPSILTLRQQIPAVPPAPVFPPTRAHFTVLAEFDDRVIGDISRHGDPAIGPSVISWRSLNPAAASVNAAGWITAHDAASATTIEATLPAELGVRTISATVQNALPWETPLPGGQPAVAQVLPESANPAAMVTQPSLLFISDGFTSTEKPLFEGLVKRLVRRWKRARSTRPFDIVPMNYLSVWIPSRQRGSTVRNAIQLHGRRPGKLWGRAVPSPEEFTITGAGVTTVGQLVHQVGLPIPDEADATFANWRAKETDWHNLYGAAHIGPLSLDIYKQWVKLADYMICLERDTAFGLMTGRGAPHAEGEDDGRVAGWHEFRTQRSDVDKMLTQLVDQHGHGVGGPWLAGGRNRPFVLALMGGARAAGARSLPDEELIASGLVDHLAMRMVPPAGAPPPPGRILDLRPHDLPRALGNDAYGTFTHESAHALDLLDEYGGVKDVTVAGRQSVREGAWNLQVADDTNTVGILWAAWPRILAAGLLVQNVAAPGAAFQVTVKHPHGRAFRAGDRVRLRPRPFLELRPLPAPAVGNRLTYLPESNDLQVFGAPVLNPAGDVIQLQVVGGGALNPPNWLANGAILFKPEGTLVVQADVRAFITNRGNIPLNRNVAACVEDVDEIQRVQAPALLGLLRRGKPKYPSWIHGIYDGGDDYHCGVFHASGACLMRTLQVPRPAPNSGVLYRFCHVCRYVMVDQLDPSKHGIIEANYKGIYPERR